MSRSAHTAMLAALLACTIVSCAGRRPRDSWRRASAQGQGGIHAVLINGGGLRDRNYRSHLEHIRGVAGLLTASGVPGERITIFSSDGSDPKADLATRDPGRFPDHWLLSGSKLGRLLPDLQFENSEVAGFELLPAKRAAIETWFHVQREHLGPGDTLLLYVTDHGNRARKNGGATIALWGERLSQEDLTGWLHQLHPGVRVVLWMSQCYAGAFAKAMYDDSERHTVRGNVCGFFSTLADRLAWGCFPESRDHRELLGHSLRFLQALQPGGDLGSAHDRVVITDRTPNVPHRTSDIFLRQLLEREAKRRKKPAAILADKLLFRAWKDRGRWARERALLDALSRRLGVDPVRTYRDLLPVERELRKHLRQCGAYRSRWRDAYRNLAKHTVTTFQTEHPSWEARSLTELSRKLGVSKKTGEAAEESRLALTAKLLALLGVFVRTEPGLYDRLEVLRTRGRDTSEVETRLRVREGALLRIRLILDSVAGEVLASEADEATETLHLLRSCENTSIPRDQGGAMSPALVFAEDEIVPLPPLDEDVSRLARFRPAWLGVRFGPEDEVLREEHGLPAGAVVVRSVFPGSPAEEAGLHTGDTLLGPPGKPFLEPDALRERVMLTHPGEALPLQVLRDGKRLQVIPVIRLLPEKLPELAAKLEKGQKAPGRDGLRTFRGQPVAADQPVLLFFFATWCGPCKRAVPEILAWEKQHGIAVLAITTEEEETLTSFLDRFGAPFPGRIARDPRGLIVDAHHARSFPTFVLIDATGQVRAFKKGYATLEDLRP